MAILWLALITSYIFSPYGVSYARDRVANSWYLLSMFSKIFLFYFISVLLINNQKKYHYLIIVFLVTIEYYIFWANHQYLSGQMYVYSPRLSGPGLWGIYGDENAFAMLFVMGIPFLYFMGNYYKKKVIKYILWGSIPFGWHAIFLTGSLGGLIGLSVITLFIALRSKRRSFLVAIPTALLIAFLYQGGDFLIKRVERASRGGITQQSTAQTRFDSWKVGLEMLLEHPVTGVGIGNFLPIYPKYSDTKAHVAHNTFLQFASESGILAGLMYLVICLNLFRSYLRQIKQDNKDIDPFFLAARESIAGGMAGFFVCALFLNLAAYETLYYLLVLNLAQNRLVRSAPANLSHTQSQLELT